MHRFRDGGFGKKGTWVFLESLHRGFVVRKGDVALKNAGARWPSAVSFCITSAVFFVDRDGPQSC